MYVCMYVCLYVCMYVCTFFLEMCTRLFGEFQGLWPDATVAVASCGLLLVVVASFSEVVDFKFGLVVSCCQGTGVHGLCRQPLIEVVMFLVF